MKRALVLSMLVILLVVGLLRDRGNHRARPATPAAARPRFEVHVIAAESGAPILGARVVAADMGSTTMVLTAKDGRCALPLPPCRGGELRLNVSAARRRSFAALVNEERARIAGPIVVALERSVRTAAGRVVGFGAGEDWVCRMEAAPVHPGVVFSTPARLDFTPTADGRFRVRIPVVVPAELTFLRRSERGVAGARMPVFEGADPVDLGEVVATSVVIGVRVEDQRDRAVTGARVVFRAGRDPGRAVAAVTDLEGRVAFHAPPPQPGAVAGTVDLRLGKRILGGFSVFAGGENRLSVRR